MGVIVCKKNHRIAIVDATRTPFCKAGTSMSGIPADVLGAHVLSELIARNRYFEEITSEIITGNVSQPANAANISRVISLRAGLKNSIPAMTVHRNCASGMEAVSNAATRILAGEGDAYVALGIESMSNIPLLFGQKMRHLFENLSKAKTTLQRLMTLSRFRPSFLSPEVGLVLGLTDPTCGLIMGLTAENIAKDFQISRRDQDAFSLSSHKKSEKARNDGVFTREITPIFDGISQMIEHDNGMRDGQTIEALAKLRPYFEKNHGTVTVGNSSQITDGACGVLLMSENLAKEAGIVPLGYIKGFAYEGCDQTRMGLGPVFSNTKLLTAAKMNITDFDMIEINEAFAAQTIGCILAMGSQSFYDKNINGANALGNIDIAKLNMNGGAIALGHPVGASGMRLIIHVAKELQRKNLGSALVSLCVGGGQGASFMIENN